MLKIGEFSKLCFISVRMLRHYHEIGLLVPACTDGETGYRYYTAAQLVTAGRIRRMRNMGFGLGAITEIFEHCRDSQSLREYLLRQQQVLGAQRTLIDGQLALLQTTLDDLGKDDIMQYTVIKKEMPERRVASLRQVIPQYIEEGNLWAMLRQELAPLPIKYADPPYNAAIFHDTEYQESNIDVEIQTAVTGNYQDTAHVHFVQVPAQEIITITFQGDFEQMNEVCTTAASWIAENGCRFSAPMFNIYHVSPAMEQDSSKWVTEVCFPIQKI